MKKFTILAVAALTLASASADTMDFTYNLQGAEVDYYGTGKKENYDVAICIDNPSLKGAKITGLSVVVPGDLETYADPSAFLTSELKVERVDGVRVNVADIATQEAVLADGYLTATFSEPYTLTGEPVYVGYSLSVSVLDDVNKYPIAVAPGDNQNGFWIHTSRTQLKWANFVNHFSDPLQSAMVIHLEGDFAAESAGVALPARTVLLTDQENPYSFSVINGGANAIANIEYTYSINGHESSGTYTFESPIAAALGSFGTAEILLPAESERGEYTISVNLTKVNGVENTNPAAMGEALVIYSPVIPVARPLIEEYTGLWCGWCPRGYAALEYMGEKYGHEFVGAAWHNADPMAITGTSGYPNQVAGFPAAIANRYMDINLVEIENLWPAYCAEEVPFSLSCSLKYTDATKSAVKATADVASIEKLTDFYTIGYLLVADDLKSTSWMQSNNYAGRYDLAAAEMPEKYAEIFGNGGPIIVGLTFNDVVVGKEYMAGVDNALPQTIEQFRHYTNEVSMDITGIKSSYDGSEIPIVPGKVRVLAYILDAKGRVVTACSSDYPAEPSGVNAVADAAEVVSSVWYDLQGNVVTNPQGGIFVRVNTMSDGTLQAVKVAVR